MIYPHSNLYRPILVCLKDFEAKIIKDGAGWETNEARGWFAPGTHETTIRIVKVTKKMKEENEKLSHHIIEIEGELTRLEERIKELESGIKEKEETVPAVL